MTLNFYIVVNILLSENDFQYLSAYGEAEDEKGKGGEHRAK